MKRGVISYKQLFDTFYLLIITGVFIGLMYSSNLEIKRGNFDEKVKCVNIGGTISKMISMDGEVEVEVNFKENFNLDEKYVYVDNIKCEYIGSRIEKVKFVKEGDKIKLIKEARHG